MFNILAIKVIQMKTTMTYHLISVRMAMIKQNKTKQMKSPQDTTKHSRKCGKEKPLLIAGGRAN